MTRTELTAKLTGLVQRVPAPARVAIPLALVAALAGALVLWRSGPPPPVVPMPEPAGFVVTPDGGDVPRLTPIRVTFPERPAQQAGAQLLKLDPPVKGAYAWLGDRTLQLEPEFPGLLRGQQYTIRVAGVAAAGVPDDFTKTFTTAGRLVVDQVIPQDKDGEIPLNAQVLVQFNRSVAPLTTLQAQRTEPVVTSTPPLTGKGEWLNTSVYRLTPDNLKPSTTYQLTVKAGLSSEADGVLQADYAWSFTTVGPAVAEVSPHDNAVDAGPREPVVITFTLPMDRASVEAAVQVSRVTSTYQWSDDSTTLTITPSVAYPPGIKLTVTVPKGLRDAGGGETAIDWSSTFTVVGAPAVTSTSPANGASNAGRYGARITFATPMNHASVEDRLSVSGVDMDKVRYFWGNEKGISINVELDPAAAYTVTLRAGATDRFGQALGAYGFSFTTGRLDPALNLAVPGAGVTYSASVEPVLYYHTLNITSPVTFQLFPLTAAERDSFGATPQGNWRPSQPAARTWSQTPDSQPDVVALSSTSLSGGGPLRPGDYLLQAASPGVRGANVFVLSVVNSVLILKKATTELLVWAVDHDSGAPLANVPLKAQGTGVQQSAATTDKDGVARFPYVYPTQADNPIVVTLDDGAHRGMVTERWTQGAATYQLGVPVSVYRPGYVGYLFPDRPIYRPGETVGYKAIVRQDDDATYAVPTNASLQARINDPTGKPVNTETFTVNGYGSSAGTLTLTGDAPVGQYTITVMDGNRVVTSAGFQVQEFKAPEFQVNLTTDRQDYTDGERIGATGEATFFFGGALAGAPVTWSVQASPHVFRPKGYTDYSFVDFDRFRQAVVREVLRANGATTTDAAGRFTFGVTAALNGSEGAQSFDVGATVTDENAQQVGDGHAVVVHPASFYAGVKPAKYLATAGSEAAIDVVTVDLSGKPLPLQPVSVKVYDRQWVTSKEQTPGGGLRYRSDPKDTLLAALPTTTDGDAKATVRYTPKGPGSLRLVAEVTDSRGRVGRSAGYLWVTGNEYASWQVANNDVLQLVADKDTYQVGDVAQVMVPSPYAGMQGLVTVERGKVLTAEVHAFAGNSDTIQIPIRDNFLPNVYAGVVLYRPPSAGDPAPRYKIGYVKLAVSTESRALKVEVTPDRPQTHPGEHVKYRIQVTDTAGKPVRAEVSVSVVDKAVLSLVEDRTRTGLQAFWFERLLGVFTSSSMAVSVNRTNDVIADLAQGGKGGGGSDDTRTRKDFRNSASWQPQVETGADGVAVVEVTMPDNLTTWHTQVRAISGDTMVGEATNELVSTQQLLLRPALPRFLREGDALSVRVLVRNSTTQPVQAQVSLKAAGLDVTDGAKRSVTIQPAASQMAEWPAKASREGKATLTFTATAPNGLSDELVQELPIYPGLTPETTSTNGIVTGEPKAEAVFLPSYAAQQGGKLQVSVQSSLVGNLGAELEPLQPRTWPEGPLDFATRLIAEVGVRRADPSLKTGAGPATDAALDTEVRRLAVTQRPDGGWAWCTQPSCQSDPYVTAWALIALGEAKREGRPAAFDLQKAGAYLSLQLSLPTDVRAEEQVDKRALLLYAQEAAGIPQTSAIHALVEQSRAKLSPWGKAFAALGLGWGAAANDTALDAMVADLNADVIASANGNHWESPVKGVSYHTSITTSAVALLALVRLQPNHPLISESVRWLQVARSAQGWTSRGDRAFAILAIAEYASATGELGGSGSYRAQLDGKDILSGQVAAGVRITDATDVPLSRLTPGRVDVLTFLRDFTQQGRLYYTAILRYLTPSPHVEALNRGIAVSREYTRQEDPNTPITEAKLGDTVRVKLTILTGQDLNYVQVADLLPAGLEAVNPALKITDAATLAKLNDDRRRAGPANANRGYIAPWFIGYYNPWQQVQIRDDRVTLSTSRLARGVSEYIYYARVTTPGTFLAQPAVAEDSAFPEVFGRSDSGTFTAKPS